MTAEAKHTGFVVRLPEPPYPMVAKCSGCGWEGTPTDSAVEAWEHALAHTDYTVLEAWGGREQVLDELISGESRVD